MAGRVLNGLDRNTLLILDHGYGLSGLCGFMTLGEEVKGLATVLPALSLA